MSSAAPPGRAAERSHNWSTPDARTLERSPGWRPLQRGVRRHAVLWCGMGATTTRQAGSPAKTTAVHVRILKEELPLGLVGFHSGPTLEPVTGRQGCVKSTAVPKSFILRSRNIHAECRLTDYEFSGAAGQPPEGTDGRRQNTTALRNGTGRVRCNEGLGDKTSAVEGESGLAGWHRRAGKRSLGSLDAGLRP